MERIEHKAEKLYNDINDLLPSSLTDAAQIGMEAIRLSFHKARDPQLIRFVARLSATTLSREAVSIIMMRKAKNLDKIFGTDRSDALVSILLNSYCFPILDDIITAEVDRLIQVSDSSFYGDTAQSPLDSIVLSHIKRFDLDEAVEIIKGFCTKEKTPEYYESIGMDPLNTRTYAATRNWKDNGLVYQFRITDNQLFMKCSDKPWKPLLMPEGKIPRIVAADNNRCFVLTTDNELWWYCIKQDQAQWSIDIMRTAVEFMKLKPIAGQEFCDIFTSITAEIVDSIANLASIDKKFRQWRRSEDNDTRTYWHTRCKGWTDVALSIDRFLLKTGDGISFTAQDYAEWSRNAHSDSAWSNLLRWTSGDITFHRGNNVPVDSIIDIAVGNWNGTVVTMYILAQGKLWFIDEEIIHPEWKVIEQWNTKWAILDTEYHPIENSPYPLDSTCRVDAANSVIAVSKVSPGTSSVFWIRWDYHQKDDFVYWPLDWCEHRWHEIISPRMKDSDFRIVTFGDLDPREDNTVWSIPAPAFTFHNYLPKEGYRGIFGDVPREQVSSYPVEIFVRDTSDSVRYFSIKEAGKLSGSTVQWTVYN
jgi:hypothetical protein